MGFSLKPCSPLLYSREAEIGASREVCRAEEEWKAGELPEQEEKEECHQRQAPSALTEELVTAGQTYCCLALGFTLPWPGLEDGRPSSPVSARHCTVMLLGSRAEAELKEIVLFVADMSSLLVIYTMTGW